MYNIVQGRSLRLVSADSSGNPRLCFSKPLLSTTITSFLINVKFLVCSMGCVLVDVKEGKKGCSL